MHRSPRMSRLYHTDPIVYVDSICFLLGERMSRESIRQGAEEAQITGVFTLSEEESERIDPTLVEIGIEPEPVFAFRTFHFTLYQIHHFY